MPGRRQLCLVLAGVVVPVLLAGCAAVLGPRTIEISDAELQERVARSFPYHNRVLELLDITVSAPRLKVLPDSQRIAAVLGVRAEDRLLGHALTGALALSCGVRFEPRDHTVRLTEVRLEHFHIEGAPALVQRQLQRIGQLLADQLLRDEIVHTLRSEDVQALQRQGYRPGDLKLSSRGIGLTLHPAP